MRRAVWAAVIVGSACLVASPLVFLALGLVYGTGLSHCADPGGCTDEIIWAPYVGAALTALLGAACLGAAGWLHRRTPTASRGP